MNPELIAAIHALIKKFNGRGVHNPLIFNTQADAHSFSRACAKMTYWNGTAMVDANLHAVQNSNQVSVFHNSPGGIALSVLTRTHA